MRLVLKVILLLNISLGAKLRLRAELRLGPKLRLRAELSLRLRGLQLRRLLGALLGVRGILHVLLRRPLLEALLKRLTLLLACEPLLHAVFGRPSFVLALIVVLVVLSLAVVVLRSPNLHIVLRIHRLHHVGVCRGCINMDYLGLSLWVRYILLIYTNILFYEIFNFPQLEIIIHNM